MAESNLSTTEAKRITSLFRYISQVFSGWRRWVVTTLWALPITLTGLYSLGHSELDMPALIDIVPLSKLLIIFLLWLSFTIAITFVLFINGSYNLAKTIQAESSVKIRDISILRQYYGNRMEMPKLLYELNDCCCRLINKQRIPKIIEVKGWRVQWRMLKALISIILMANIFKFMAMWFLNMITLNNPRIFKAQKASLVISMLSNINAGLSGYNLGGIPASKHKEYIDIYEQIKKMEVGMPPRIIGKINRCLRLLNSINCLLLVRPERSYWKDIAIPKIFNHTLPYLQVIIDDTEIQLIGEISEDISKFLEV